MRLMFGYVVHVASIADLFDVRNFWHIKIMTIVCNIAEIVKLAKGESETQLSKMTQSEQDTYEMHVRAANIVSCTGITLEYNYKIY
jgi:hypothetical protein